MSQPRPANKNAVKTILGGLFFPAAPLDAGKGEYFNNRRPQNKFRAASKQKWIALKTNISTCVRNPSISLSPYGTTR